MADIMFSDIDINLERQTDGDITRMTEADAIKNSLKNILTTSKMTRRMLPEFGASIDELLFEPMHEITAKRIGQIMYDEISFWEYRIVIDSVDVVGQPDKNQYNVTIAYHIRGIGELGASSVKFILKQV